MADPILRRRGVDLARQVDRPTNVLQPLSFTDDEEEVFDVRTCRVCGCTDDDCSECIEATGEPCTWVEPDLCSRCV